HWDDALVKQNTFGRVAQIVPAVIVHTGVSWVPGVSAVVIKIIHNVANAWMILVVTLTLIAVLKAGNRIYDRGPLSRGRPIKGFVQIAEIVLYLFGGVLIVGALIDRSPLILLSGMGALSAVLMFVFKDTLLSLLASMQLSGQDMIRVGDWLEAPQFGADGDVTDVELFTVTVQNWDKTITKIPTSKLVYDSFKNWRGMSESGGRRIMRSLDIDVNSIRFLTDDEVQRFTQFTLLKDYMAAKQGELAAYNDALPADGKSEVNLRKLTNIGTLRAYLVSYLKHHPKIHQGMTLIVRQLQSGPEGLPMEIYCFSNDTDWVAYEDLQSDIFDHTCAILPEFGLRLYQRPAGADLVGLQMERAEG
ncbi:MAG: mechanosensitive ion channel family protein, partial [Gammaproteobacteria bacterium]